MKLASLVALVLLAPGTSARRAVEASDTPALLASLALGAQEREEGLALALALARTGDCEGALAHLDALADANDELARRLAIERGRLIAWIELRDAYLAELVASQKPLALELELGGKPGGKKLSAPIQREGNELVLARGPVKRLSVQALAPEALVAAMPKERFEGAAEWLKIYPYCVSGSPKWKRLTTGSEAADELKRDALEVYPPLAALGPQVLALDGLAHSPAPNDAAAARALLARLEALLALGRERACLRARLPALTELAAQLLAQASQALAVADLVHARVSAASGDALRLSYDFAAPGQADDWRRDDDYLDELRASLGPLHEDAAAHFAPGPGGFDGGGEFCWRHALEFRAPLRVRYHVCWAKPPGPPAETFAFALGILADEQGHNVRAHELGFLYVNEADRPYSVTRPQGNPTVLLGQNYAMELVHDGARAEVWVEGERRAQADAPTRTEGGIFLWGHSDLRLRVSEIEIEGRVTEASLVRARARWAEAQLAALGLGPAR